MNKFRINRIINESVDEMLDGIIDDEINAYDARNSRMANDRDYAFHNCEFPSMEDEMPRDEEGDILDLDDLYRDHGDNSRDRVSGIDPRMDAMFTDWEHSPYNEEGDYEEHYR